MVAAWGGYVFIINIIPIYVVAIIVAGRYSHRLYVAYTTFYVLGSLMAMNVPFVGFNVLQQAECAASHGVFVLVQVAAFIKVTKLDQLDQKAVRRLLVIGATAAVGSVAVLLLSMQLLGLTQWTGRSLTLLDPTYAKKYIPIIASVSEHQPTAWTSFFFDLHICVPLAPVGLYFLFEKLTDAKIFLIIYGTISWYFAGVMVRLMLTLAPAACMLAAIGISGLLNTMASHTKLGIAESLKKEEEDVPAVTKSTSTKRSAQKEKKSLAKKAQEFVPLPVPLTITVLIGVLGLLGFYAMHAVYVASEAYSSPSIVLASRRADGSKVIFDDFREAYYWLRMNTKSDAKVMSWWDYGYQTSAMANRTVLVDNNTWNNTHIATVGRAMASREEDAYPIMESLDADYVLVIFGGVTGYSGDDINKFLWMVRIGGGVFPHIKEPDYFAGGQFRVDAGGSPTLLNCMMYKLCYYRFDELQAEYSRPGGYDRARNVEIGNKGFELTHLEEAFTSEHWIVRIFKVKKRETFDATSSAPSLKDPARTKRITSPTFKREVQEKPKYVGCFMSEDAFGGKVYGGGTTGANLGLAKHHAQSHGKKYFAVARNGGDGHSFSFSQLRGRPDRNPSSGCTRPCMDDQSQACGCADAGCGTDPLPAGQEHNRRWAVYELAGGKK